MIVSQRIAGLFKDYGFICLDPLYDWLVTKRIPSTAQILNILSKNPLHHARSVAPWKVDPQHWIEKRRGEWVKLPDDDPTFGKTNIGGTSWGLGIGWSAACKASLTEDGTVTSITHYNDYDDTVNLQTALYDHSAGPENQEILSSSESCLANSWHEFDVVDKFLSAQTLWPAAYGATALTLAYDDGGDTYYKEENLDDPWDPNGFYISRTFSIYVTYTIWEEKVAGSITPQIMQLLRAGLI